MPAIRSALILTLSAGFLAILAPLASAEVGLSGISGGTTISGGGRGISTDNNYAQSNTNMIHPGSIGGGVANVGSIGGANTDDASSVSGGHANIRGLGPPGAVSNSRNNATKIGGTGAGAAVPGGVGG